MRNTNWNHTSAFWEIVHHVVECQKCQNDWKEETHAEYRRVSPKCNKPMDQYKWAFFHPRWTPCAEVTRLIDYYEGRVDERMSDRQPPMRRGNYEITRFGPATRSPY